MDKFAIFKSAIAIPVGLGASRIAKAIIDNHIDPVTTMDKFLCGFGRLGIALTASAIVTKHVDEQMDEYKALYGSIKNVKSSVSKAAQTK